MDLASLFLEMVKDYRKGVGIMQTGNTEEGKVNRGGLNRGFLVTLIALIIVVVGFTYYYAQVSAAISRNEEADVLLQGQVASLQAQLSSANSQVSSLQRQLSDANTQSCLVYVDRAFGERI